MATRRPGRGSGSSLEGVADEDAAHAVADDVEDVALGLAEEFPQPADVLVEAEHHGAVAELAHVIAETSQALAQQAHLPAADDGAVDEDDGGAGRRRRSPRPVEQGSAHVGT